MATKTAIPFRIVLLGALILALTTLSPATPSAAENPLLSASAPATPTPTAVPTLAPPTKPGYTEAPCPFELPEGQVAGKTIKCGILAVPQDRADPKSPLIGLAVATLRNPAAKIEKDPVIYLGGPGENVLDLLEMGFAEITAPAFAANRDLIVFDQRGVGLSQPALDCPEVVDLSRDSLDYTIKGKKVTDKEAADLGLAAAAACAKTLSAKTDLADFHSNATAADVEALRVALAYDKVNLWGVGHGTRLALEVLRDYPAGVRSVVLDSVIPAEVDTIKDGPANLARALDVMYKACAADKACNAAYPKLQQTFKDAVTKLEKTPLSFKTTDPFTGKSYDALMDGDDLVGLVRVGLGSSDLLPVLPLLIAASAQGDATLASAMLGTMVGLQPFISDGAAYSYLCHDEIAFATQKDVDAAITAVVAKYPELTGYFETALEGKLALSLCQKWNAGKADAADNKPVTSSVPALVLAGSYDHVSAPAWGQATAKNLKKAFFFEYPGLGNSVSLEPCPTEMIAAFLKDPAKSPDAACVKKLGPPAWEIPGQVKMAPYLQPSMGIQGVVPEGWQETDTGQFERQSAEGDSTILLAQAGAMTAKDMASLMAQQLGVQGGLSGGKPYKSKTITWTLYVVKASSAYIDIAIGESDGLALLVLLQSLPDERDALLDAVYSPVVEALTPITGPAVDASKAYLEALKKKDYTAITAATDPELLKAVGGSTALLAWIKDNKVEPASWSLLGRDLAADAAQIVGIVTRPDKTQFTLTLTLSLVNGKWLVGDLSVE